MTKAEIHLRFMEAIIGGRFAKGNFSEVVKEIKNGEIISRSKNMDELAADSSDQAASLLKIYLQHWPNLKLED